jgi:hypothetical protein
MATTTNYSWTTPDDTALVKDGAAAIRTLGSSADTTVKALNPGTTSGDLDYYTSSTAKARIGIGTNGQVLTSNGTIPSWVTPSSGGMTLISTTTLTGASVTLSSIPATYNSLFLIISGVTGATSNTYVRILPNNVNNLSDLTIIYNTTLGSRTAAGIQLGTSQEPLRTSANNIYAIEIFNYASTSTFKAFSGTGLYFDVTSANARTAQFGAFRSTTAISSLVLDRDGGGDFSTGTVLLYGVK